LDDDDGDADEHDGGNDDGDLDRCLLLGLHFFLDTPVVVDAVAGVGVFVVVVAGLGDEDISSIDMDGTNRVRVLLLPLPTALPGALALSTLVSHDRWWCSGCGCWKALHRGWCARR